jgi:hypothetical protein
MSGRLRLASPAPRRGCQLSSLAVSEEAIVCKPRACDVWLGMPARVIGVIGRQLLDDMSITRSRV